MNLSKIELQEMLREMGLKFSPEASYDELRQMFQAENHRRWLGQNRPDGPKRVIRRRRPVAVPTAEVASQAAVTQPAATEATTGEPIPEGGNADDRLAARTASRPRRHLPIRRLRRTDGEAVVFDRQQNVFATVLRRAKRRCELCESAPPEEVAQQELQPFYLVPLSEGGQEVIKNVVALCPGCLHKMTSQPTAADVKTLKRRARQKVISSVVVIRR